MYPVQTEAADSACIQFRRRQLIVHVSSSHGGSWQCMYPVQTEAADSAAGRSGVWSAVECGGQAGVCRSASWTDTLSAADRCPCWRGLMRGPPTDGDYPATNCTLCQQPGEGLARCQEQIRADQMHIDMGMAARCRLGASLLARDRRGGGVGSDPPRFFLNNVSGVTGIDAKLGIPLRMSIWRLLQNFESFPQKLFEICRFKWPKIMLFSVENG